MDTVSHVTLLAHESSTGPLTSYKNKPAVEHAALVTGRDPRLDALFARMRSQGTVLDATAGMWAADALADDDPAVIERARRNTELAIALTAQAHRAGVELATGTDYETDPDDPFPALYEELAFLVRRCGIPTLDVLRSATLVGTRSAGVDHLTGTVEPGKLADFAVFARTRWPTSTTFARYRPSSEAAASRGAPTPPNAPGRTVDRNPDDHQRARPTRQPQRPAVDGGGRRSEPTSEQFSIDARTLADARASGLTAVNITLGYVMGDLPPYEHTLHEIDVWDAIVTRHTNDLLKVTTVADIRTARRDGRIGVVYGFQNAVAVGDDVGRIATFAQRGVRVVQLTYNQANRLGGGSAAPATTH